MLSFQFDNNYFNHLNTLEVFLSESGGVNKFEYSLKLLFEGVLRSCASF